CCPRSRTWPRASADGSCRSCLTSLPGEAGDEGVEESRLARRRAPRPGGEREARGEACRHGLDREDLVPRRPAGAAEDPARGRVEGVDAAAALVEVEPRGVLPEAGQDARGADEGDAPVEAEPARPPGEPCDRLEAPALDHTHLAVAAVVDPEPAGMQTRRVRPREPA